MLADFDCGTLLGLHPRHPLTQALVFTQMQKLVARKAELQRLVDGTMA